MECEGEGEGVYEAPARSSPHTPASIIHVPLTPFLLLTWRQTPSSQGAFYCLREHTGRRAHASLCSAAPSLIFHDALWLSRDDRRRFPCTHVHTSVCVCICSMMLMSCAVVTLLEFCEFEPPDLLAVPTGAEPPGMQGICGSPAERKVEPQAVE